MKRATPPPPGGKDGGKGKTVSVADQGAVGEGWRWDAFGNRWVRSTTAGVEGGRPAGFTKVETLTGDTYTSWPVMYGALEKAGIASYDVATVEREVRSGKAVLVDIRLRKQYERETACGAVNAQLFRPATGRGGFYTLRRAAFAFLGLTPTERNPNFAADAEAAVLASPNGAGKRGKRSRVYLMCGPGGTMERIARTTKLAAGSNEAYTKEFADPDRAFGRESRSLKACYELLTEDKGWTDVRHVKEGLSAWRFERLDCEAGQTAM